MKKILLTTLVFVLAFNLSLNKISNSRFSTPPFRAGETAQAEVAIAVPYAALLTASVLITAAYYASVIDESTYTRLGAAISEAGREIKEGSYYIAKSIWEEIERIIEHMMARVQDNEVSRQAKVDINFRGPGDWEKLCAKLQEYMDNANFPEKVIDQAAKYMGCKNVRKVRRGQGRDDDEYL